MVARLILDPPAFGSWNMAKDQVLAEYANRTGEIVLRLYGWKEPTLSLGYFQESEGRSSVGTLATLPYVRRATGGGAIVHDREVTYSLAVPQETSKGPDADLYQDLHQSLIDTFQGLGWNAALARGTCGFCATKGNSNSSFLCFDRRSEFDIVVDGSKIVGSAQRRYGNTILQHGSVLLHASRAAPHLLGLMDIQRVESVAAIEASFEGWTRVVVDSIARALPNVSHWDSFEEHLDSEIQSVVESRFESPSWNDRR